MYCSFHELQNTIFITVIFGGTWSAAATASMSDTDPVPLNKQSFFTAIISIAEKDVNLYDEYILSYFLIPNTDLLWYRGIPLIDNK